MLMHRHTFKATNRHIYPCGKIANSYFSDEFEMVPNSGGTAGVNILKSEGIAWESDKRWRYKKPHISSWSDITTYFDLPPGAAFLMIKYLY